MIESFHIIQLCWVPHARWWGGCLSSLLPVDFIPSTPYHLFWDWNLESFFECLETCSHQWQVLLPLTVFGNTSMSPDRWILSSVWPQHSYSHLLVFTLLPWFPFSLSVGDLASVNSIHQWPVIRGWNTMFNLDTSIHIVGHVLVADCVEDFPDWSHFWHATSLIVPVFMRFQLLWLDSSVCQIFLAITEILTHYISSNFMEIMILYISSSWRFSYIYILHDDDHICHIVSCLFMAIVLLCIRAAICICSYMKSCIIV